MNLKILILCIAFGFIQIGNVSSFFSLQTDLQFGYQLSDLSSEINSKFPIIGSLSNRNYIIQTDQRVRKCIVGLKSLTTQMQYPVSFFNEIQTLGSTRVNNEATIVGKLNSSFVTLNKALQVTLSPNGLLADIAEVMPAQEVEKIEFSLQNILDNSKMLIDSFTVLSKDITPLRANITSLTILTPTFIRENLNETTKDQILQSLQSIRNSVDLLTDSIKETNRVSLAQGSIYDTLYRYNTVDSNSKTSALTNFNNSHNRALNNILSVAKTNNASAYTSFNRFISSTRTKYNDNIVRPVFEGEHMPVINNFINLTIDYIYNLERIEQTFNIFRDIVLDSQKNTTKIILDKATLIREKIIELQKTPYFIKVYSSCIDDLVSGAQLLTRWGTSKYVKCINARTSGVNLILPTVRSALNVFRDSVNLVLEQLNICIGYSTTVEGRTQTSECLDNVVVNLPHFGKLMAENAQNNVRRIIDGQIRLYESCLRSASGEVVEYVDIFDQEFNKCNGLANGNTPSTTEPTTIFQSTTFEPTTTFQSTTFEPTTTFQSTTSEVETTTEVFTTEESTTTDIPQ
jgi:hypothetical protein